MICVCVPNDEKRIFRDQSRHSTLRLGLVVWTRFHKHVAVTLVLASCIRESELRYLSKSTRHLA
jgi:hypothetical protein